VTIFGVDLSDYDTARGNGPAVVARYRAAGISFLTHKSTESAPGSVFRHNNLGRMLTAGRDSGIPFLGAYVVPRTGVPVATQGANHVAFLDAQVPWWRAFPGWFHQVDLEKWPYDAVAASVGNQLVDWLRSNGAGKGVVLYASKGQYGTSALASPRWNAAYPNNTAREFKSLYAAVGGDTGPGWNAYGSPSRVAEIWQYASAGIVTGQGTTDVNAYRGTEADFAQMIGATLALTPERKDVPMFMAKTATDPAVRLSDGFRWKRLEAAPFSSLRSAGLPLITVPNLAALDAVCGVEWTATDALSPVDISAVTNAAAQGARAALDGATAIIRPATPPPAQ
jgi:hypothetical protein